MSRGGSASSKAGVLVVGVDSLMTQLGKCCRPAPPDAILGFVSRGKGVSIHRATCTNVRHMQQAHPERIIEVSWEAQPLSTTLYPVHVEVLAVDRQGLLRDVSEVFAREKLNVIGVQTASFKEMARMGFTVEVRNTQELSLALHGIQMVNGVKQAKRA
jgi:GTP pyrophosphokinase